MKNIHSGGFWIKMQDFWRFVHCRSSLTTRNLLHFNGNVSLIFWLPAALYWLKWRRNIVRISHHIRFLCKSLEATQQHQHGKKEKKRSDGSDSLVHKDFYSFVLDFLSKEGRNVCIIWQNDAISILFTPKIDRYILR